jgi:para-nitrobenzyl esterase
MLFFYGGSYVYGAASFLAYEAAERIARNPNTIIVTSNYRLQSLGYLGGDLLREPGTNTTGNWGMLDQRAAMQWVQDNAVAFGGDANKVSHVFVVCLCVNTMTSMITTNPFFSSLLIF